MKKIEKWGSSQKGSGVFKRVFCFKVVVVLYADGNGPIDRKSLILQGGDEDCW